MVPAHWKLTVKYRGNPGSQVWEWPIDEEDKAWRIFEAYRNTIKMHSGIIHENWDGNIQSDYGSARLEFIEEHEEPICEGDTGIVFAPYIPYMLDIELNSYRNEDCND